MPTHKYTSEERIAVFWSRVNRSNGENSCWLWLGPRFKDGYGKTNWNNKSRRAHRVSWEIAYGEIPKGLLICHRCDTPLCVNPSHLFLGTVLDNAIDMMQKGRAAKGERHGMHTHPESRSLGDRNGQYTHPENTARGEAHGCHKLTELQVREIRQLYIEKGISQRQLARTFGITKTQVRRIVRGESWKHIE